MSSSSQTPTPLSNVKPIIDDALGEYKMKTGNELLDDPLVAEVQRCDTVGAALAILQDQAEAFQNGDQRLMEQIYPLVRAIFAFSGTLGIGDVGLVVRLIRGD